jgi:CubicO group peptidase (beta-lactamase class C family)
VSTSRGNENISLFLAERIAAGDFPSAVYTVASGGRVVFADALGSAVRVPEEIPATINTIYDLASLTKPLITGLLCAQSLEREQLVVEGRVAEFLPEFRRPDKQTISIGQLLTHTSGLPPWRPLYVVTGGDKNRVVEAIAREPLESAPGAVVRYSDLGFIVLGKILERLQSESLADIARRDIFEPLGLKSTFFNPDERLRRKIAASETGNEYERRMCTEMGIQMPEELREGVIWGKVHDGNAYFMGGAAGHAGLFAPASETLRIASQFVGANSQLLKPRTCELFRTNLTEGLEEARSFAWQLAATAGSTAGPSLPADSFGHTGFSGTSCWVDAEREKVFILLTNRTHDRALPFVNINSVRRRFHSLAVAALSENKLES